MEKAPAASVPHPGLGALLNAIKPHQPRYKLQAVSKNQKARGLLRPRSSSFLWQMEYGALGRVGTC